MMQESTHEWGGAVEGLGPRRGGPGGSVGRGGVQVG